MLPDQFAGHRVERIGDVDVPIPLNLRRDEYGHVIDRGRYRPQHVVARHAHGTGLSRFLPRSWDHLGWADARHRCNTTTADRQWS